MAATYLNWEYELGRWLKQTILGSLGSQGASTDVPALCGGADRAR